MTDSNAIKAEIAAYRAGYDVYDKQIVARPGKSCASVSELGKDFPMGRFCVPVEGVPFECFFHAAGDEAPSWLYVVYSGSASEAEIANGTPVFRRWGYYPIVESLGGAILCIADPMIHRHKIPVGYYYGTADTSFAALSLEIVKACCAFYAVPSARVIFLASSAGGHAALYASSLLDGSLSVTINPRIDLYRAPLTERFLAATGIDLLAPDPLHRNELADVLRNSPSRHLVLFNVQDDRDMAQDALPLCDALGIVPRYGLSGQGNVLLWLYDAPPTVGAAHNAQETRRIFLAIDRIAKELHLASAPMDIVQPQVLLANELWHDIYAERKAAYIARTQLQRMMDVIWLYDRYPVRMSSQRIVFQAFSVRLEAKASAFRAYSYSGFAPRRLYSILVEADADFPEYTIRLYDDALKQTLADDVVPTGRRNYFSFVTKAAVDITFHVYAGIAGKTQGNTLLVKRLAVMARPGSDMATKYEERDERQNDWGAVHWHGACRAALARNPWTAGTSLDDYDPYALPWRELFELQHILEERRPMNVLQLGLGESSKLLARYAATMGASYIVLDEDEAWSDEFMERNQEVFGEAKVRPQILPLVEREHGGYRCCMFQGLADAVGARRFQLAILHRSRGGGDCLAHGELGDGLLDFLAERFVLLVEHADESEEQLLLHDFSGLCEQRGIRARKSFVPLKDGELCVVSACP